MTVRGWQGDSGLSADYLFGTGCEPCPTGVRAHIRRGAGGACHAKKTTPLPPPVAASSTGLVLSRLFFFAHGLSHKNLIRLCHGRRPYCTPSCLSQTQGAPTLRGRLPSVAADLGLRLHRARRRPFAHVARTAPLLCPQRLIRKSWRRRRWLAWRSGDEPRCVIRRGPPAPIAVTGMTMGQSEGQKGLFAPWIHSISCRWAGGGPLELTGCPLPLRGRLKTVIGPINPPFRGHTERRHEARH